MSLRESRAEDERKGRAERVEVVARAAADHDEEAWTSSHQIQSLFAAINQSIARSFWIIKVLSGIISDS